MINPKICAKCKFATIHQPEYDKQGNKISLWNVDCAASSLFNVYHVPDTFNMSDDPPPKCPYLLEHKISMQDVSDDDKDYLSNIFTQ